MPKFSISDILHIYYKLLLTAWKIYCEKLSVIIKDSDLPNKISV